MVEKEKLKWDLFFKHPLPFVTFSILRPFGSRSPFFLRKRGSSLHVLTDNDSFWSKKFFKQDPSLFLTLERLNLVVLKVRVIHPKCITTAISRIAKIDKLHQAKVVHGQTQGKKLKDIWGKIAGSLNLTWPSFLILLLLQQPFQSAINLHCVCLIWYDTGWTGILDKNFRKGLDVVVIIVQYLLNCALIADVWFIRCPCRACHGKSTTFNEWQWLCKKQKICSQSKEVYC